jgi:hypothetical protein
MEPSPDSRRYSVHLEASYRAGALPARPLTRHAALVVLGAKVANESS